MEVNNLVEIISTLGFPIACVIFMGFFIYHIYNTWTKQNAEQMEKMQNRCQEREEKLYTEIAKNREVNAKAIETIAHYAEKIDIIQKDISDIKTDIIVIKTKE